MSNIHVLTREGDAYHLVLHIATPVGTNSAALAWSTALVRAYAPVTKLLSGDGTGGTISAAEAAAVLAGATLEIPTDFMSTLTFESESGQAQLAEIDAWYTAITNARLAELQHQLQRFGSTFS